MTAAIFKRLPARDRSYGLRASMRRAVQLLLFTLPGTAALATPPGKGCTTIDEPLARLACYDRALARTEATTGTPPPTAIDSSAAIPAELGKSAFGSGELSSLSNVWDLSPSEKSGTFKLMPHKANYLLPLHYTSRVNSMPASPAPGHAVPFNLPLDATEAKFQLSFKVKAWENLLGDNGDVWLAYTQQSNWQLSNGGLSSPFRATDYEPELIFSLRTDADLLGWRWRMLNLGFVHQSNGRALPLSRSWNRVYAQFGLERGPFTLMLRPWYRLPESAASDDNPDIGNYMGSGDIRLAYAKGGHVLSALAHYSFKGKRGGLQADWVFPISGSLKGYLQVTSGYGANLIDYNHSQTTLGVGLLLLPWQ